MGWRIAIDHRDENDIVKSIKDFGAGMAPIRIKIHSLGMLNLIF